jgi:hypothetical protein
MALRLKTNIVSFKNRLKTRVALIELLDLSGIAVGNVGVPTCLDCGHSDVNFTKARPPPTSLEAGGPSASFASFLAGKLFSFLPCRRAYSGIHHQKLLVKVFIVLWFCGEYFVTRRPLYQQCLVGT